MGRWQTKFSIKCEELQSCAALDEATWKLNFIEGCETTKLSIKGRWEATWVEESDGKRLINDFCKEFGVVGSPSRFKLRVLSEMKEARSENWVMLNTLLTELMTGTF